MDEEPSNYSLFAPLLDEEFEDMNRPEEIVTEDEDDITENKVVSMREVAESVTETPAHALVTNVVYEFPIDLDELLMDI